MEMRSISGIRAAGLRGRYGEVWEDSAGSEPNGTNFNVVFTEEDRRLFLDLLKIRREIDRCSLRCFGGAAGRIFVGFRNGL